jgi:molybdate transport system substrate-binding protein
MRESFRLPCVRTMAALLCVALTGCGVRPHETIVPAASQSPPSAARPTAAGPQGTVTVLAPALLQPYLEDACKQYAAQQRDVKVELKTYPAEESAPEVTADVLLSPDGPDLAALGDAGVSVTGDKKSFGRVPVAVAVTRGNPHRLKTLEALGKASGVTVAVPDPQQEAAGAAFEAALREAGLWGQVESKIVPVASGEAARKALEAGRVQAAVSYAPALIFAGARSKTGLGFYLGAEQTPSIELVALLGTPQGTAAAEAFVQFLSTAAAQTLLEKWGFQPTDISARKSSKSLLVPCGAGLQPAMDLIAEEYEKRTGVRVDFSYAGAQMLLGQLAFSRRGDLYMPGEGFWVMQAVERGYVDQHRPVVYFTPVIMVPKGNPKNVRTVQDMARPGVRVALGHPEALAVGPLTKRILQRAGVWDTIHKNVVMEAGCIPELTNAVVMKGADAGIMWDASALQVKEHIDIVPIAPELNEVAEVLLATLKFSEDLTEARRFMDYVASDEAKAIFEKMEFNTERPEGIRLAPLEGPGVTK